jgi:hypothetical protein
VDERIETAALLLQKAKHDFKRALGQCDDLLELSIYIDPANEFDAGNLQATYGLDGATPWAGRTLSPHTQPA